MSPGRRLTVALVGLVALVVIGWFVKDGSSGAPPPGTTKPVVTSSVSGESVPGARSGLDVEALSKLPAEAGKTWKLIEANGPFPYPRNDGVTFENREKRLPQQKSGYYKEYTVPTPGSPDRGARRMVTGSEEEVFYTGDHYSTFVVVDVKK
ncbi:ribonuclease domain-containing protein [Lentzea sp.]|uniref:ribonuclease domain-containing protein n=1 Tax=Lentzea sp. TaxID=56099 RepID=UPI002C5EDEDB|nr:ribonuclease domain-containing protein [Lentzea sp.]HUQ59499.1 ribonuclease domain-containing protein [Lentzea sp.]